MKDRLLLKDLVPGKPSTWNRHALSFVYDTNEDASSVPVELVYPDDSISLGCNAVTCTNTNRTSEDNNELLESIDNSTLVVFASKHFEYGYAFASHKKLTILIAIYILYTILLLFLSLYSPDNFYYPFTECDNDFGSDLCSYAHLICVRIGLGFHIINGYKNLIFNILTSLSHLLCIGFMIRRIEFLLYIHTLVSNIMLCISSIHANNLLQILGSVIQTLICFHSFKALEKESSHVFVTYNLQQ